ncbi:MAG: hypothetical protein V9G19_13170 [Tetrasphaera sp.]
MGGISNDIIRDAQPSSRRTLAKGAAWSIPVMAMGSFAPARAASLPPGLQGWVNLIKGCDTQSPRNMTVEINGIGNYPTRGLWVYNTTPTTVITGAKLTLYFPSDWNVTSITAATGNSGWSVPAPDSSVPVKPGLQAYSTTYTGTWQYVAASGGNPAYSYTVGQPHFMATAVVTAGQGYCSTNGFPVTARRTVFVNGHEVTFERSILL